MLIENVQNDQNIKWLSHKNMSVFQMGGYFENP